MPCMLSGARVFASLLCFFLSIACAARQSQGSNNALHTSVLWGQHGELFNATGRLLDWSYAGYAAAEAPNPDVEVLVDVKEHGAAGDGIKDDTRAIEAAIVALVNKGVKAGSPGALLFPPGTYRIERPITIRSSGVVLRGCGPDTTTLFLPYSLTHVFGQKWEGAKYTKSGDDKNHSDWKSGPGFIRFAGARDYLAGGTWLADVKGRAARGSHVLDVPVLEEGHIKPGDWVTLAQGDQGGTLISDLTGNLTDAFLPCTTFCQDTPNLLRFHSRVVGVHHGQVVLERPIPWNVSEMWRPQLHLFGMGQLHDVGIEDISVVHYFSEYGGHLKEAGWNGIEFKMATNCWARNVHIMDSDNALSAWLSSFCTFDRLKIFASEPRGHNAKGHDSHHSINITQSNDILVSNFELNELAVHSVSVYAFTYGVAVVNGTGPDLALDHHRLMPFGTLWSNISTGLGKRTFATGGDGTWGPSSGPFTTFWNVRADNASQPLYWSKHGLDGPHLNFVGCRLEGGGWLQKKARAWGWHVEQPPTNIHQLNPAELYTEQLHSLRHLRQHPTSGHGLH